MRSPYTGFFAKQIMGPEALDNYLLQSVAGELENTVGIVCGETVFDPSGAGVGLGITVSVDSLNNRKITVTGDKNAVTDAGDLMACGSTSTDRSYTSGSYTIKVHDNDWFQDIPYRNANGATYYVYLGQTKFPIDVGVARDGSRGYSVWTDAVGFTVVPGSVTLSAGKIILKLDATITALGMQQWLTTNTESASWSMDCIVWLDTTQVGVSVQSDDPSVAIAVAKLTKDAATSAWRVDLTAIADGKLGQATASTTAAHYKVAVLGPLITDSTALQSSSAYVFIGSVVSGASETISTAGQAVTVPYASYAAGFSIEHNGVTSSADLGRHKQVTAQAGSDLNLRVDSGSDKLVNVTNMGAGKAILVVEDEMRVPIIRQGGDLSVIFENDIADTYLRVANTGTMACFVVLDADVATSKTFGGSGNITAAGMYKIDSADVYEAKYAAESIMMAGFHTGFGGGVLSYSDGGGTSVPYVFVNAGIAAVKTVYIPIHNPTNFQASAIRVHYNMSAAGTPSIRVAIGRWTEGTTAVFNTTTWLACSTFSGAWVTQTLTWAGNQLTGNANEKFYLMIEITNNGIADNTAKVHKVSIQGTMVYMPAFQQ